MVLDKEGEEEEVIRRTTTITDRIHRLFHLKATSQYSEEINKFLQAQVSTIFQVANNNKLIVVRRSNGRQLTRDEQKKKGYKKKISHRKITKEEITIIEILTKITLVVLEITIITATAITTILSRILTLTTAV